MSKIAWDSHLIAIAELSLGQLPNLTLLTFTDISSKIASQTILGTKVICSTTRAQFEALALLSRSCLIRSHVKRDCIRKLIYNSQIDCQLPHLSIRRTLYRDPQEIVSMQGMADLASHRANQAPDGPVSSRTRKCESNQGLLGRVEQRIRDGPRTRSQMRSPRKHGQPHGGAPSAPGVASNPLQACSSNSGTSLRPSDASALSSSGNVDIASDKGYGQAGALHGRTMGAQASLLQSSIIEHGQLTHAFRGTAAPSGAQKKLQPLIPRTSQSASSEKSGTYLTRLRSTYHGPATEDSQGGEEGPPQQPAERAVKDSDQRATSDPHIQIEQLKPYKKLNSETVPMRVTRSKAKQRQKRQDVSSLADVSEVETVAAFANPAPNGQQKIDLCGNCEMIDYEGSDERPTPTLPKVSLEALAPESITAWREEECKQNASPKSQHSHMMIATPAEGKFNTSFQVTEQSDALLENPLCTLIKTYQNLRANASSTGKNKPTIHLFNERFEKEINDLEEQYQLQKQLRKEQMRVFEQNYGSAGAKTPTTTCKQARTINRLAAEAGPLANDQPFTARAGTHGGGLRALLAFAAAAEDCQMTGGADSSAHGGTNNLLDISYNNSQLCAKENSQLGGTSELTIANEVYQSFKFVPNAMLNFYPKEIKRILNRRKTNNSQNLIYADLKQIRAPKQFVKLRKAQHKLKGLSLCQMNMMQVLMQKISRKSKVIKKQERIVSANLRRKEIHLEDENFNIVDYIERRAELKKAQEFSQAQSQASEKRQAGRARHSEVSPKQQMSRDPSSAGSRSNQVLRETSTNARMPQYLGVPYEVHSNDGNGSRKLNKSSLHEGAGVQGTVSTTEMGGVAATIHSGAPSAKRKGSYQLESQQTVTQTPEPPSKMAPAGATANQENKQYLKAAEQIRLAVNGLGDIEDSLSGRLSRSNFDQDPQRLGSSQLVGKNLSQRAEESCERQPTPVDTSQAYCGYDDLASVVLEQTPQRIFSKNGIMGTKHSETPMLDYEHQKAFFCENEDPAAPKLTQQQHARAARTSQPEKKPKTARRALESIQRVDLTQKFNEEYAAGDYAIADLRKPYLIENKNVEEQHHPDGKISLTIRMTNNAPSKNAATATAGGKKNESKGNSGSKQRKTLTKAHTVELPLKGMPQGNSSGTNHLNSRSGDGLGSNKPDLSPLQQHEKQQSEVVHSIAAQVDSDGRVDYKALGNFTSQMNITAQQCYGLNFLGTGNLNIQNEPFIFGGPPAAQEQATKGNLIDELIREPPAASHHQNPHQAVHQLYKSQSALVPPSHFFGHHAYPSIIENPAINVIDRILDDSPDDEMPAQLPSQNKNHSRIMDPFFDVESPQELSSIEHSHTAFNQTHGNQDDFQGANPYAAAKRKYIYQKLREQQRQQRQDDARNGAAEQGGEPAIAIPVERMAFSAMQGDDGDHPMQFETVNTYEGHHRRQTSIDQPMQAAEDEQSPETKIMNERQSQIVIAGTTTPNRFTQIEGNVLLSNSRDLDPNRAHLPDQNQLSVGRLCAGMQQEQSFSHAFTIMGHGELGAHNGARHAAVEGQSALGSSVKVHQLSQMRGNIANTPAGLLSGQQVMAEAHRQNFTVSDWNIEDNEPATPAGLSQGMAPHMPAQVQPKQSPGTQLYPILRDPVNMI